MKISGFFNNALDNLDVVYTCLTVKIWIEQTDLCFLGVSHFNLIVSRIDELLLEEPIGYLFNEYHLDKNLNDQSVVKIITKFVGTGSKS